jgi:hypothetical protein
MPPAVAATRNSQPPSDRPRLVLAGELFRHGLHPRDVRRLYLAAVEYVDLHGRPCWLVFEIDKRGRSGQGCDLPA